MLINPPLTTSSSLLDEDQTKISAVPVGTLKITRSISKFGVGGIATTPGSIQPQAIPKIKNVSVIDFIELYSYSQLVVIFAYIIAMAVIGMAYGGSSKQKKEQEEQTSMFFIEYMISIILIPVANTLLTLALKNRLQMRQASYLVRVTYWKSMNKVYNFEMINNETTWIEKQLFCLDLSLITHGLVGLLYTLIA